MQNDRIREADPLGGEGVKADYFSIGREKIFLLTNSFCPRLLCCAENRKQGKYDFANKG